MAGRWLALVGAMLAGCARVEPVTAWDDGAVVVQARFAARAPDLRRSLAGLPDGTTRIEVRVTGAGVPDDAVLAATLAPDRTRALFASVPAGPKAIVARAYDADARILAAGRAELAIVAGATVAAHLRLEPVGDEGAFALVIE